MDRPIERPPQESASRSACLQNRDAVLLENERFATPSGGADRDRGAGGIRPCPARAGTRDHPRSRDRRPRRSNRAGTRPTTGGGARARSRSRGRTRSCPTEPEPAPTPNPGTWKNPLRPPAQRRRHRTNPAAIPTRCMPTARSTRKNARTAITRLRLARRS